jgi:hypothetical protein
MFPDSSLGDDIHIGSFDASATPLSPDLGIAEVCTFIDRDADHDSFRFVAPGASVELEATADIPLILQLHDASGRLLATSENESGAPRPTTVTLQNVSTEARQQYFVLVHSTKGGRGAYQLLVHVGESLVSADVDVDGIVAFRDFLILASHFGKTANAVFAEGDIDGDQDVDFEDFLILSEQFGRTG